MYWNSQLLEKITGSNFILFLETRNRILILITSAIVYWISFGKQLLKKATRFSKVFSNLRMHLTQVIRYTMYTFFLLICDPSCEKGPYGNFEKYRPWSDDAVRASNFSLLADFILYEVKILPY